MLITPVTVLARCHTAVGVGNIAHGIMTIMKLFFGIASLLLAASLACSAYKSAGSQTLPKENSNLSQALPQTNTTSPQEKTPCTLTLVGAPSINGVRLGLTTDEVLALFPGSKEDLELKSDLARPPSQFGTSSFIIKPAKYETKDQFTGINQFAFSFLDGRLYNFTAGYNGPEYPHVDKFVASFIEGTTLPPVDQWQPFTGMDNTLKVLRCSEFEVNIFIGGPGGNLNYARAKDLVAEKKLNERRAKARANASPGP